MNTLKTLIILAYVTCLVSITGLIGCASFSNPPLGGDDFVVPTNLPPNIVTNDLELIENYYDGDLTPGNDGSDLTQ